MGALTTRKKIVSNKEKLKDAIDESEKNRSFFL
jgi:hypothetical protein